MPNYVLYRDDLEVIAPDEAETHAKIIEVMADGQNITRQKYDGRAVRISHAKAHGIVQGELIVHQGLPPDLAQGLFAQPATYPVVVRLSHAPGELTDDAKVSTPRGMALKIFNVAGERLPGSDGATTQDWVLDTGKEFITAGVKAFLQAFKPNAEIAPKLSDSVKGAVSQISLGTNKILDAIGFGSAKLDFYGHPNLHPLAEPYFSQTPYRYGDYVAKIAVVPASPGLETLEFEPRTYNAMREAVVEYFGAHAAEFDIQIQLNTDVAKMPIEDATASWSEEESPFRSVARLVIPLQDAYDPARKNLVEGDFSFSPAHALAAHRPLGGINRARLVVYGAMAAMRRQENARPLEEPAAPANAFASAAQSVA